MRLPAVARHEMSAWRVCSGDVSTDGRWCFMIFKVTLGQAMRAHWALLRRRLEAICPSTHGDHSMWRYTSRTRDTQHPFLLQVTSYDRRGFLHGALRPRSLRSLPPLPGIISDILPWNTTLQQPADRLLRPPWLPAQCACRRSFSEGIFHEGA